MKLQLNTKTFNEIHPNKKKQAMKIYSNKKHVMKYTHIKQRSMKYIQICAQKCTNIKKNMESNTLK